MKYRKYFLANWKKAIASFFLFALGAGLILFSSVTSKAFTEEITVILGGFIILAGIILLWFALLSAELGFYYFSFHLFKKTSRFFKQIVNKKGKGKPKRKLNNLIKLFALLKEPLFLC